MTVVFTFAILNTVGFQKHVQRKNKNYNNEDIDQEKLAENYDLIHGHIKTIKIDCRIAEGYKGERKIRSDAIKHVDGVITSDQDFFKEMDPDKVRMFFQDAKSFLEKEYGEKNLVYATVHLDEATPHMHFGVVPITKDGRLSAKDEYKRFLSTHEDESLKNNLKPSESEYRGI